MATRKDIVAADFFQRYIQSTHEEELVKAIRRNTKQFEKLLEKIPRKKVDYAYAEGKWTIKQVLQHVIDAERVFTFRALSFSRQDPAALPGFDENNWAAHAQTAHRRWKDIVREFRSVRRATEYLYESFTEDQLLATGTASNNPANVLAFGFICAGHAAHHIRIIKERYL